MVCVLIAFLILLFIRVKLFRLCLCLLFVVLCLGVKNENNKDYRGITESIKRFFIVLLDVRG